MKRRNNSPLFTRKHLKWAGIFFLAAFSLFALYCAYLFNDLSQMMSKTPGFRPTVIYSDIYIARVGDIYSNLFLKERLADLKINFQQSDSSISWKQKKWDCPEEILSPESPLRVRTDANMKVRFEEDRIVEILSNDQPKDAFALEPTAIARLSGSSTEIREYLKLDEIPAKLVQAIMAIEDQRFLEHFGFDPRSFIRAMWINVRSQSLAQGGSTLTQQLVKNLLGTRQKTVSRKVKELALALLIEIKYSKEEILEKYLNEIYFGQIGALEVHGVAEAARYYFNKSVDKLTLAEIAALTGMIRGPYYYSPYKYRDRTIERKNTVLKKMAELGQITEKELKVSTNEKLQFAAPLTGINKAPYFVDFVKAQILEELADVVSASDLSSEGLKVYTTLDIPLQRRADEAVAKNVAALEARYKIQRPLRLEGLLVAAESSTGFVRALVGGRSYAETTFNRVLNMKRNVGSAFKPIVYLSAFIKGNDEEGNPYSPAYMITDEPWVHEYDKKKWSPKNYEKAYRGSIPLREAFINSINIPMAKIAVDVGLENVVEVAKSMGIASPMQAVPALSLGAVDLSAMELLQAYGVFANHGERVDITTVRVIVDSNEKVLAKFNPQATQVFDRKATDVVNSLLHDVTTSGTAKALAQMGYDKISFGKTGTTNFSRDAWFAGYSENLTAVTWVGFDELVTPAEDDEVGARKFKSPALLTGAGAALPIWAAFFKTSKPSNFSQALAVEFDPALEKHKVSKIQGCLMDSSPSSDEAFEAYFMPGSAPAECH